MATQRLFVGNLSYSCNESELMELFQEYGCSSARIIEGRGFGFVDVEEDKASPAIDATNDQEFQGRRLTVNVARPREDR